MAEPLGTARSSVVTLINSSVGAGVLSFPFAFKAFGWAAGLAVVVLIGTVESFTLYVLRCELAHCLLAVCLAPLAGACLAL